MGIMDEELAKNNDDLARVRKDKFLNTQKI